ncbi:MAG: hypothetical protein QXJ62_04330, partial [Nitrososphaeria archaeon]
MLAKIYFIIKIVKLIYNIFLKCFHQNRKRLKIFYSIYPMTYMIETPRYLGPIPHPAIGVRMPKIFLEGILTAFKERNTAGGLM